MHLKKLFNNNEILLSIVSFFSPYCNISNLAVSETSLCPVEGGLIGVRPSRGVARIKLLGFLGIEWEGHSIDRRPGEGV